MTGRDGGAELEPIASSPVVILVRPQACRQHRCLRTRHGERWAVLPAPGRAARRWPQEKAWRNAASGADRILNAATVFPSVPDAVADLHRVFATCPRPRHIIKPVLTARGAPPPELHENRCAQSTKPAYCSARSACRTRQRRHGAGRCAGALSAQSGVHVAQSGPGRRWCWPTNGGLSPEGRLRPRELMTNETHVATKAELEENFLHTHPDRSARRVRFSAQSAKASGHGAHHSSLLPARRSHRRSRNCVRCMGVS